MLFLELSLIPRVLLLIPVCDYSNAFHAQTCVSGHNNFVLSMFYDIQELIWTIYILTITTYFLHIHLPSLDKHPVNSTAKQTGLTILKPWCSRNSKRVVLIAGHSGITLVL